MSAQTTDSLISEELRSQIERTRAAGELPSQENIKSQLEVFKGTFGPDVLRNADGDALLKLLHGRQDPQSRCLAYWLEFKDDEEFRGRAFGGIGGGSALKFGIYQRPKDGTWIGGSPSAMATLTREDAVAFARQQRDELLAGHEVLSAMDSMNFSDEAYARLQSEMDRVAGNLAGSSWAHKYWFLIHSDKIDDYHVPTLQRYHLLKLLQMPPDEIGIFDYGAGRFLCGGRFASLARELGVPVPILTATLNRRDGGFRQYWRVGTTVGSTGESQWQVMRDGGFVSIGFQESIPDVAELIAADKENARDTIRTRLIEAGQTNPSVATKKAGEILNFVSEMADEDLVLACDGMTVLGVGRVTGPYQYDNSLRFPHKRPVEWLLVDEWHLPDKEALQTTFTRFGRSATNLLELERRLFAARKTPPARPANRGEAPKLPSLDPFASRVDSILRRKSQVILYGPPGTGKTFRALAVARELASRKAYGKPFAGLKPEERAQVDDTRRGLVRVCTFHPGYGYEDFIEGFRPKSVDGRLVFEPAAGIFKQLCEDAAAVPERDFFLVIDEINRGDIPRIFGELLTILEQDKRGRSVILPVTGLPFFVPKNVLVVGTMNTADRSISLLDAALRRRFGFVELMPDSTVLKDQSVGDLRLGAWLDALNLRLLRNLKRDARNLQVGHAYLMPSKPITSVAEFSKVLRDDIIPLLEEYCYEDFSSLREILGSRLVDVELARIRDEIFQPGREEELMQAVWFEEMQTVLLDQKEAESGPEEEGETDSSA